MSLKKWLVGVIEDGTVTDEAEVGQAIDAFNDILRQEGHWVFAWGLHSPESSTIIDNRNDQGREFLGSLNPYRAGDAFISGIWIIQAESEVVAKSLAAQGSKACNRKVELRPFH